MKTLIGFLAGAAAVALVTTERGRRLCDEIVDEIGKSAKQAIKQKTQEVDHDGERSAAASH